jgi:hypothetical protein
MFAAACVALTAAGHSMADAHRPVGLVALGVGFVGVFLAGLLTTGRERSQATILGGVFAAQITLHVLFTYLPTPSTEHIPGRISGRISGHPATMNMAGMAPGSPPSGALHSGPVPEHGGWAMLGVHAGAGLAVAWWLRRGEVACWRLLRRVEVAASAAVPDMLAHLRHLVRGLTLRADSPTPDTIAAHEVGEAMIVLLAGCVPRRGPPHPARAR